MTGPKTGGPRLPETAEALLTDWPSPKRSAGDWDALAERTLQRVAEIAPGSTDEALLAAPLPREPGEPEAASAPEEEARGSGGNAKRPDIALDDVPEGESLAAIARAAVAARTQQAPSTDLVKAGMSQAMRRRPVAPPPAAPHAVASPHPSRPRAPEAVEAPEAGQTPAPAGSQSAEAPAPAARSDRGRDRVVIWALSGALAAAAAALVYVSTRPDESQPLALQSPATAEGAPRSRPAAEPERPPPGSEAETETQSDEGTNEYVALEELPADEDPKAGSSARAPAAPKRKAKSTAGGSPPEPASAEPASEALDEAVASRAAAAAPSSKPLRPAARKRPLPEEPALGAVQAALGGSMTGARRCLAGQDEASKVTVTFGSDGAVDRVAVSGPAAGTTAQSCIEGAFMGARVPPFSKDDFSAAITVRPP